MVAIAPRSESAHAVSPNADSLDAFVADIEALCRVHHDDRALADAVAERLARLVRDPDWLPARHRVPADEGYCPHLVHVAPDGRWSLVSLVWKPGQRTPIHDHVSWCVVGVHRGEEYETTYRLAGEEAAPYLIATAQTVNPIGSVVALVPPGDIHRVKNSCDGVAVSIHVYGADVSALGSSILRRYDLAVRPGLPA